MIYIQGIGHVSALAMGNRLPATPSLPSGLIYKANEPDYTQYIDARLLRRMARIIKMSAAAANMALADAQAKELDAIITGTGLGCIEDTQEFLKDIVANNETLPSPTAFIKSTHNTIGGQIALMGNHYCYNMSYAHRAFSFESALLDATLQLSEGANHILVGGIDELTDVSAKLLQRLGCIASETHPDAPKGGEGAVFMVLGTEQSANSYACLNNVFATHNRDAVTALADFIGDASIDLVLTGAHSVKNFEEQYLPPLKAVVPNAAYGQYKNTCGEYHTASAVGTVLAAMMLKEQAIPPYTLLDGTAPRLLNNVLVYNRSAADGHAFILLSQC